MRLRCRTGLLSKISLLLAILLLSGLVFTGCRGAVGAVAKGWSGGTITGDILFIGSMKGELVAINITDGNRLWAVPIEEAGSGGGLLSCGPASTAVAIYGSPAVAGDLVYVGGYNGKIYTISINNLLSEDKYLNKSSPKTIVGSPVIAGDSIYIGSSDGRIYALDVKSRNEKWRFETGDKIWSTPAIDGDVLYIGSFDQKVYALDINDGSKKWEFETEGAIVATPLVDNNTVYIGSFDRYLYAVDAADGSLKWKFMAGNWFWAKPVVHNGVIYAGCLDGKVYAFDAESGGKLVEFDLGGQVSSSPVVVGNLVIVANQDGVVYALDTGNNQQRQLVNLEENVYAPLVSGMEKVYIHTDKDSLYEIDARTGAKRELNIKAE